MDLIGFLGVLLAYSGIPIGIGWAIGGWMFSKGTLTDLVRSAFKSIFFVYVIAVVMIVVGFSAK